jgi:hypothetical protein
MALHPFPEVICRLPAKPPEGLRCRFWGDAMPCNAHGHSADLLYQVRPAGIENIDEWKDFGDLMHRRHPALARNVAGGWPGPFRLLGAQVFRRLFVEHADQRLTV